MNPSPTRTGRRRNPRSAAIALTIACAFAAPAVPAAPPASDADLLWLRVEVTGHGESGTPRIKINVPLSLMEVVVESLDGKSIFDHLDSGQGRIDIRKMWQSIRDMNIDEFLTIEGEGESVKVYKDREFFRVDVRKEEGSEEVEIKIPIGLMDYFFDAQQKRFDFQELVSALRRHAPLQIVRVESREESVSIWIEER